MSWGQSPQPRPSFEVASVRVNTSNGAVDFVPRRSGDRVTMHNTRLVQVIIYAYHVVNASYQISGNYQLPDGWNWYDIEAIAPGMPAEDNLRLMFQSLLEERFKIKVHRETRESPQYDLVIAKTGSKLKAADSESKIGAEGRFIGTGRAVIAGFNDGLHLMGKGATMDQLAASLSGQLRATVTDRTGLTGTFDYNVLFSRDDTPTDVAGPPPLTTAIQEELGLKLETHKGSVEVLVIDHVEKPSAN
jgi:uncharacterized protein (TIGR03435 family)